MRKIKKYEISGYYLCEFLLPQTLQYPIFLRKKEALHFTYLCFCSFDELYSINRPWLRYISIHLTVSVIPDLIDFDIV